MIVNATLYVKIAIDDDAIENHLDESACELIDCGCSTEEDAVHCLAGDEIAQKNFDIKDFRSQPL